MGNELDSWHIIRKILDQHPYPNYEEGVFTNFITSQCDFKEKIKQKIDINCEDI
jgi:hypothetical protein